MRCQNPAPAKNQTAVVHPKAYSLDRLRYPSPIWIQKLHKFTKRTLYCLAIFHNANIKTKFRFRQPTHCSSTRPKRGHVSTVSSLIWNSFCLEPTLHSEKAYTVLLLLKNYRKNICKPFEKSLRPAISKLFTEYFSYYFNFRISEFRNVGLL
jgi:hypothetical protein